MEKDRNVTFVRSRAEIVEMMEKIYNLMSKGKIEPIRAIIMTDALDWVISDSNYLDQVVEDCEKNDIN